MRTIPIFPADPARSSASPSRAPEVRWGEFSISPPLSVYVHIPWCVRKCPYCDFNSHESSGELPEAAYLDALITDLESALPDIWGRPVQSIFFGGGTPSLFSPEGIDRLITRIRMLTALSPEAEITLEANPGTVEASRFAGFRAAGINRLSLGIQSFNNTHLRALGRIHDAQVARQAAESARQHFDRLNLDLMYGLPGQNFADAMQDLSTALDLAPDHLSCYQLTLEPNTHFAAFPPELPEGDLCADMQEAIESTLAGAGFGHYETSAFATVNQRCQHNLNYWYFGDYLGIGAGAHSKLTHHDGVVRQMRWKHPNRYLELAPKGQAIQEQHRVAASDLPAEFLMNALRLTEGFPAGLFEARTAQSLDTILPALRQAATDGLLTLSPKTSGLHIQPTLRGQRYLNRLLGYFLSV